MWTGMNDVLAKPFTKEGMIRILRRHLTYLLKNPPPPGTLDDMGQPVGGGGQQSGYVNASNMGGMSAIQPSNLANVKFETTPIQSPATSSSWHSPGGGQLQNASPNMDSSAGYMTSSVSGGAAAGSSAARSNFQGGGPSPGLGSSALRNLAESMSNDDRPEKRQRMYGPGQYA